MFLAEAKEEDGQMTKNWTEDTGGVLVFVSFKRFHFSSTTKRVKY